MIDKFIEWADKGIEVSIRHVRRKGVKYYLADISRHGMNGRMVE